ncbi:PAS domain S-box protein [Pseudodesulfovibrio tunisiensis]|uniref:PAS domain S-box protein n=1 Tax=Pseudodesulfovibrio tunisiensis TaxID=463192 RepID=UPI001FB4F6B3|nr:PAS domain S-box protein [Pseudodesulfovibrio tunisiensis]
MEQLRQWMTANEDKLMLRSLELAKEHGYTQYTPLVLEAWRMPVVRLANALSQTMDANPELLSGPIADAGLKNNPASRFIRKLARDHGERGISMPQFLGLLKCFRLAFLETAVDLMAAPDEVAAGLDGLTRFFDLLELSLAEECECDDPEGALGRISERNRQLSVDRNRLLTVLESLSCPIFVISPTRNVESMNSAAAELVGMNNLPGVTYYAARADRQDRLRDSPPLEALAPWLASELPDLPDSRTTDSSQCFELRAESFTPSRVFQVSICSLPDSTGNYSGHSIILDDISGLESMRRKAEVERNRAEHYLDIAGAMILVLDTAGNIKLINREGLRVLGYEADEMRGMNWIEHVIPQESRNTVRQVFRRVASGESGIRKGKVFNEVQTKDGRRRMVSWNNALLKGEDGKPCGILSSGTDITDILRVERNYRSLFDAAANAVLVHDMKGRFLDANQAACRTLGYTRQELLERSITDLERDNYMRRLPSLLRRIEREGHAAFESTHTTREGRQFPVAVNATLVKYDGDKAVMIVVRDITDRLLAEEAMRRSEEKFRSIFETMQEGYLVVSLEGTILMANPAAAETLGYTVKQLTGMPMNDFYANRQDRERLRKQLLATGSAKRLQFPAVRSDGSTIIVEASVRMVRNESGDPVAFEGTFHDATDRIRAEEILKDREAQYRSFFENNHAVMLLIDPRTGEITDANPAAKSFYGYSRDKLKSMRIDEINTLSQEEIFREMAAARSERRKHFQFRHRLANGDVRDVEVYSGPIMVRGTQLLYSLVHDVTERVHLENETRRMATVDALTGAWNRRQFFVRGEQEFNRFRRYKGPLALFMIDIDHFKRINDTHGHLAGDCVLKALSGFAMHTLRDTDVFARVGGEEFAVLLPELDLENALAVAERLRSGLKGLRTSSETETIVFTVSIGVTLADPSDSDIEAALARADRALYQAKDNGRDRVESL